MSLEAINRFAVPNPINVEGQPKDSALHALAFEQDHVREIVSDYVTKRTQIQSSDRITDVGKQEDTLALGKKKLAELDALQNKIFGHVDAKLRTLNETLGITDDERSVSDTLEVIFLRQDLLGMERLVRKSAVENAFFTGDRLVILAVLSWPSIYEQFEASDLERWKKTYSEQRNPAVALEFSTLSDARAELRINFNGAIEGISEDSGLTKLSMRDRIDPQAVLDESQKLRTQSTEDQLSGANQRSPHEPNKAVA